MPLWRWRPGKTRQRPIRAIEVPIPRMLNLSALRRETKESQKHLPPNGRGELDIGYTWNASLISFPAVTRSPSFNSLCSSGVAERPSASMVLRVLIASMSAAYFVLSEPAPISSLGVIW